MRLAAINLFKVENIDQPNSTKIVEKCSSLHGGTRVALVVQLCVVGLWAEWEATTGACRKTVLILTRPANLGRLRRRSATDFG